MRKNEILLLKFSPIVIMLFILQLGLAINPNKDFNKTYDATIACNDTVNIAMDFDCITEVLPDQLLEGDYPDMGIFKVTVYDENDLPIGNTVTGDQVGLTLVGEVLDTTTGNKCWSHINIIDIIGPPLQCDTIYTTCFDDFVPGTFTPHNFRFAFHPDMDIPDNDTLRLPLEVGKVAGAIISDLNIILDVEHQNDIDLAAYLVSPASDTVDLFDQLTCGGENFYVEFDDEAENTAGDLTNECKPNDPAVKGKFKSVGNLSDFDGEYLSGIWTLVVIDKNAGNVGKVKNVDILFKQNGGYVNFPIPNGASTPIYLGDNKYKVESGFEPCGSAELSFSDSLILMDCSTDYTGLIQREWKAVDESGNISICTQYIYIIRTGTAFLTWPNDYDDIDLPVLACNPNDPDFYPTPDITGKPGDELCNMVTISYTDQVIDVCSGSYKIIRHWKVNEMCSGEVLEHDQLIAVMDKTGPEIEDIPDLTLETDALECTKDVYLSLPDIISDCSDFDLISFEVGYQILDQNGNPKTPDLLNDNLELLNNGQYLLHNAPVGKIKVTYIATDDCGNSTTTSNIITIYDNDPPVAVCDQHTQVSIGTDGTAKTEALVYDDGSHDNCSNISFKVRRMNALCDTTDIIFKDSISFCCQDVGTTQMVVLKVTDESGLSNTCMVEVNIVDKFPPVIICPDDLTIKCDVDYNDLRITGIATAYDNCEVTDIQHEDFTDISQCNTGLIRRTWTAYDANGYHSSCTQLITITDFHKFKESDIVWPDDVTYYECVENFDTSITGNVKFLNEDFCSMVSARYEDETFNVVDGACKKILRHWEVIDWCNFNENNPDQSTWRYTQVIMLQNEVAPEFDETCHAREFCTYGPCAGEITYIKTATDDCTPSNQLRWYYRVDLDNDGDWDIGPVPSNDASGVYANGTHRFAWTVEDGCGNESSCEELVTVKDCKKPTPLCITQTATVIMNFGGMVTVCAEDFNLGSDNCNNCNTGSYDNCTPKEDLRYSFSSDVSDSCRTFTCDDIPDGQQVFVTIQMWVTDNAGNQDYCTVYLDLQDNEANACQDTSIGSIVYGFVYNADDIKLDNVQMQLRGEENTDYQLTDNEGRYEFNNLDDSQSYDLSASMESDYLLGVSTLDLVLIQKHILGIKTFDKPYKYIAADANNSGTISASDILTIRRAILGDSNIDSDESWVFTPDNEDLRNNPNILAIWNKKKTINASDFGKNINWVGIKIGDVNNSNSNLLENRNDENISLYLDDKHFSQNDEVKADFYFSDFKNISGAQFTLDFNSDILDFDKIIPNTNLIDKNSFGLFHLINGQIAISWIKPENVTGDKKLFTIVFNAKDSGKLSNNIGLSDNIVNSEVYDNEFNTLGIQLESRNIDKAFSGYALMQNIPNPFVNETTIAFSLPENQIATITFTDVTGRIIKKITGNYPKGTNSVVVSFDNIPSGIIYYKLETEKYTATKKMIIIK